MIRPPPSPPTSALAALPLHLEPLPHQPACCPLLIHAQCQLRILNLLLFPEALRSRAVTLALDDLSSKPGSVISSLLTQNTSLTLWVSRFPHRYNGVNNRTHLRGNCEGHATYYPLHSEECLRTHSCYHRRTAGSSSSFTSPSPAPKTPPALSTIAPLITPSLSLLYCLPHLLPSGSGLI